MPRTASSPDYRFALHPKWLLIHLLALVALAVMVAASFWQLSRLQDKQRRNERFLARSAQPVEPVEAVAPAAAGPSVLAQAEYRTVAAQGRYLTDEEVLVHSRSLDGHPGAWVLTPLLLDDGTVVAINRGWIPATDTTPTLPVGAEPPGGEVTVTGLVRASEVRGALGVEDIEGVDLTIMPRVDLLRLQEQLAPELLGVYVQLQRQDPAPSGDFPAVLPPPKLDEGPHRSYAGQWAIFAVIWVIGYPLLVRRAALRRVERRDGDAGSDTDQAGAGRPDPHPSGAN